MTWRIHCLLRPRADWPRQTWSGDKIAVPNPANRAAINATIVFGDRANRAIPKVAATAETRATEVEPNISRSQSPLNRVAAITVENAA